MGRAVDWRYPSNRAVVFLAAAGVLLGTWGSLLQSPEVGAAAVRGLLHGLLVFFAWGTAREIDPARHVTSVIAGALTCIAGIFIAESPDLTAHVLLLGAALMGTRLVSESVGGSPKVWDAPMLFLPAWIGLVDYRLATVGMAYALILVAKGLLMGAATPLVVGSLGLLVATLIQQGVLGSPAIPVVTPEGAMVGVIVSGIALLVFAGPLGRLPDADGHPVTLKPWNVWLARLTFWLLAMLAALAMVPGLPVLAIAIAIPLGALVFGKGPVVSAA